MRTLVLTVLFVLTWSGLAAQTFRLGLHGAAILSQMDGDGYTGYHKLGMRFGLRGHTTIARNVDFAVELNYEEKGARFQSLNVASQGRRNRAIHFNYAEVPVLFRFLKGGKEYFFFESGVAISYLINYSFHEGQSATPLTAFKQVMPQFKRSEWNGLLGGGLVINRHIGVYFRTSIGMSFLFRETREIKPDHLIPGTLTGMADPPVILLRNYLISFGGYFTL